MFSQAESAFEFSKKAYYLNKENIWYQLLYAELLASSGQSTKAAIIYKQLIKKHPGNEKYYYLLVDNYIYARKFLEAIKILDVDLNDVIAIGDSETDVPLFKIVENSIAVSNSTENLKKIAKIVTTKKSGEGVLEGLDSILSES